MTEDDRLVLVAVDSDVDPSSTYVYDRETGEAELLYRTRPEVPTEHMAGMRPVRYTARDGVEIPAYLTVPQGVEANDLAVVVMPHGGPWGRDVWGFDGFAQFLANRGYAVLMPNFRGSTGYGKEFLNLGNEQWGTGTMQHDISDGVQWLVEQGIADPEKVAIMGGSYGGYATLAGLAFTPELYAAGVDIVGPSNIITLLNSIPPYWKPMQKLFSVRVGDLSDPADVERMQAQSPLNSADAITAPLLVIQGANDPRVKQAESDQIVVALRDKGQPVEYLVAANEGHGFANEDNNLAMFAKIEEFLATHLGGRYQADMPPEIEQKLEELTVDVETVAVRAE
jgi:dipeptidyl aminopeptidase/acylaminoacyl peptidase